MAISSAAGTPLPATSPTATAEPAVGQRDEAVVVAADLLGRLVVGVELVAGHLRQVARAGSSSAPAGPAPGRAAPFLRGPVSSCSRAFSRAMAAWLATPQSSFRSSWVNFLLRSCVSSWMTPNALPSAPHSGTHMTERMRKSTTLWLSWMRSSRLASSLRNAWPLSRQRRTMLLLKRALVSSLRPARLDDARHAACRSPSSARMRKQRSAWRNSWNRLSHDLGQQRSQLQRLAQVAADLEQAAQLLGRLRVEQHVAAVVEHRLDGGGAVVFVRPRPRLRRAAAC